MKERPILMSAPMVRALLDGTKTVTRRIMNPQPEHLQVHTWKGKTLYDAEHRLWWWKTHSFENLIDFEVGRSQLATLCPYGVAGDRLWVKETWQTAASLDRFSPTQIAEHCQQAGYSKPWAPLRYLADGHEDNVDTLPDFGGAWGKTRVSIHMPRWASRIARDIVKSGPEPLHDITENEARIEGARPFLEVYNHFAPEQQIDGDRVDEKPYRTSFVCLWDEINGDRALFASNPWVWRVEFKGVEQAARAA